ncbi:chloride channel protein CLC-e isoform X2 [Solanum stenotomum]|uniref:chloride channel protein CLC-e isoform X2 n=1 Tax=Solanum stenotomum TaxID=172797 RepID=UPI0020D1A89A|nr:chloride channel protein CLC-e isoform X2 [Solanum stenotomum]XP_049403062.1 chloride channel protein CLC-e isoform X2 [Solanum stenotomum]XP_049403071.1 chloride channel protein CLC-e isoform X2 [Solanum stenotomum]XP_049403078.1 chloride channel protein CLC-e isoform X2 [Solanum stenotomum]
MMVALSTTSCTPNSWLNSISRRCNNDKAPFWQSRPRFGRHQSRIRCSSCWRWARPSLLPGHVRIRCSNCWRWARPSLPPGHGRSSAEKCDDSDSGIQINAQGNTAIISACFVGLFTGISVVLFNAAVHEIRDFCWDGIPSRGASWLREEPIGVIWQRVILVPASGGLLVSFLNTFRATLDVSTQGNWTSSFKSVLRPVLKTIAACVTLGTGNSLGPEGPSVEIGTSVAKGIGALLDKGAHRKLSLKAAGSAAGISSGFNAAVAGCFFAVESVLWPSPAESLSLTNTTSMVILSAVIASVVSEIGLGSEPAFAVPAYDFRTPTELPLYLLLGIFCGLVSVVLSSCTSFMLQIVENIQTASGVPKSAFPVLGGLLVGLVALAYPEILYWGFENVDILLESRPLVKGLSADLLLQLVAVKIVTTSLCRASGLVGGYYAPSLFIGAATGTAYGKIVSYIISHADPIFHLSILEVASPQAYGLVGMAATLAGVCQVPLTAVLLLFELTQDYRIVLPLLGAVGMSSWVTSGQTSKGVVQDRKKLKDAKAQMTQWQGTSSSNIGLPSLTYSSGVEPSQKESNLCKLESSLCLYESDDEENDFARKVLVAQAMRTRYVTVLMSTLLMETISLMLAEKQTCAIIVDENNFLIGLLTLGDIQNYSKWPRAEGKCQEELVVADVCSSNGNKCRVSCTVTPNTDLLSALTIMEKHGLSQLPVILRHVEDEGIHPVGILDRECINVACRALATREQLSWFSTE